MPNKPTARIPLDLPGLTGRDDLFRLDGGVKHSDAIDAWLAAEPAELRAIARQWFTHMRQCGDDVRELMHDGCPVACIGDVPFAYVNTFKSHVNVGFFRGAALDDPAALLEGAGKRMRHAKVKPGSEPAAAALAALIDAACMESRRAGLLDLHGAK